MTTVIDIPHRITFLYTDIEGSTQLWEHHPEAMKHALERHNTILRQTIESHDGHVYKMVGDGFCAAFPSAPNALTATLDAQRTLYGEAWGETPIKVRMALHTGITEAHDGDYSGPMFNRLARLMAAGHGGQILISAATYELVQANLPQDVELRDMGERRLKDLIRPEHIYQLRASGLQTEFPPLKTLEVFHTNLPAQLTSFIGREKEMSAVKRLMAEHRLTTMTGAGGTGKTRLSLQVAADLLDSFPDGVWFVELAPLADPALVPQTVLTTLGLREEMGHTILETLNGYLQPKKVLLILDNCEHLVQAVAQFAESILHSCLNLWLLVSSREALGIPGERAYHLASLSIPNAHIPQSIETVTQCEAVQLFIERAQAVLSSFTITHTNVSAVAQICTRLDGIPLAIELAAARIKMLKAEQIAERLDDSFRLLTSGSRTALPRQQTLRALIDWSYDLLPESERALLRQLSVFAGGWTLEAAEAVCSTKPSSPFIFHTSDFILDLLAQLVNKSLVVTEAEDITPAGYSTSEPRYRLLETVRQYANEKLSEASEDMAIRDAHLQYYLALAERAETELVRPQVVEWMRRLEIEQDNIRAALTWSLVSQAPQLGLRLANALWWFWSEGGHTRDGYGWLTQLLNHPQAQAHPLARARALGVMGFFLAFGDLGQDARPVLEESLALYRALEDKAGIAHCLLYLGIFTFREHNPQHGTKLVTESLEIYRELGHKLGIFSALAYLGSIIHENDYPRARAYLDEGLTICQEIEYLTGIARSLSSLGHLAFRHGDYQAAHRWLEEALPIQRQLGKGRYIIYTLSHLGELATREGDYAQATAYYEESLSLINQTGGLSTVAGWIIVKLGHAAILQGDAVNARNFFEQSMRHFKKANEKIGIVFTVEGLARVSLMQYQPEQAACLIAWADSTRKIIDNPRPLIEQADIDRDLAKIRELIEPTAFDAAQVRGGTMTMEHGIAYALQRG